MPRLIEIGLLLLEKKTFKNFQCIFILCEYLPLEKVFDLHLNNFESFLPKNEFS